MYDNETTTVWEDIKAFTFILLGFFAGGLILISIVMIIAAPFYLYEGYMQYECNDYCNPQPGIYLENQCQCRELK